MNQQRLEEQPAQESLTASSNSVIVDQSEKHAELERLRQKELRQRELEREKELDSLDRLAAFRELEESGQLYGDPPRNAKFILHLTIKNRKDRERKLGDLEEEYHLVKKRFGIRYADLFYSWWVAGEVFNAIGKQLKKWNVFVVVTEITKAFISRK